MCTLTTRMATRCSKSTQNGQSRSIGTFTYDDQNRVTSGYGESFGWEPRGVMSTLNGTALTYDASHIHAVEKLWDATISQYVDRQDYDLAGNMTVRNKGTTWNQRMKWDSHNRLAEMSGAGVSEGYLYDASGRRIRKANLLPPNNITWYPFANYEQTGSDSSTATRYYSFGGAVVAMRTGAGAPSFLYGDGVSSTVYTTDQSGIVTSARGYYAFGGLRHSEGTMPTDRHFTGQKEDATGIYYFNARYYDPQLGMFLSPDTIVSDPTLLIDYNRYGYSRANPLKYNDPSGHCVLSAVVGPAGLAVDIPCWSSGAGEAAVAAVGTGVLMGVGSLLLLRWALDDPLPDYPAPETAGDLNTVGESFPLPGSNTVSSLLPGIQMNIDVDSVVANENMFDPSQTSILADPLGNSDVGSSIYSTTLLRRNMINSGQIPPPQTDAHHIVAANDLSAAAARTLLNAAGINVNDPINGVFLPSNTRSANLTGATVHSTVHTDKYYQEVERRLSQAGSANIRAELGRIGQELQQGTFPYR